MALYEVAGLNTKIDLPVPLIISLIAPSQTNQRPGIKRQLPGYWVQHETGNTRIGADALMHMRYMFQGAPDQYGRSQQLGYHFASDERAIYQMVPIDEVTWQAADSGGPGNMSGISCEMCVNADGDMAVARHNTEALAGGVLKALGMGVDRVKRHYDFNWADPNRHHCPDYMMRDGYWETFVANVGTVIAGSAPKPQPTYAAAVSVPWQIGHDLGWQTLNGVDVLSFVAQGTTRRRGIPRAWASDSAPPTGPAIPVGTAVTLAGFFRTGDGVRWYLLGDGSRIRAISVDTDVRVIEKG